MDLISEASSVKEPRLEKPAVLVVEDEADIRRLISMHLRRDGYEVVEVESSEEALEALRTRRFECLVVDWMLPGVSGLGLIKSVRDSALRESPILMVTARTEAADIVRGLDEGADDYITKPFEVSILLARVRSLLRRGQPLSRSEKKTDTTETVIRVGELEVYPSKYEVRCGTEEVKLTASEFKLLLTLFKYRGRVLTRQALIDHVQGEGVSVIGRTIDTHVFGLRKKLGPCSDIIDTVRGVGYRIKA